MSEKNARTVIEFHGASSETINASDEPIDEKTDFLGKIVSDVIPLVGSWIYVELHDPKDRDNNPDFSGIVKEVQYGYVFSRNGKKQLDMTVYVFIEWD